MKKNFFNVFIFATSLFLAGTAGAESKEGCVIAGPSSAPVTIEEYVDFECGYCEKASSTMKKILRDYQGKVKLVLRNLPLPSHANSEIAARAFVAVWLQDSAMAYDFQERVFANQNRLSSEGQSFLMEVAKSLGLDPARVTSDMNSDQVTKILADDKKLAEKYGFKGTPSFRIGKESVVGARPYSNYKAIIDRQLGN